ncbi:MAG TPA: peptidylprolyl isomerase, partial [Gammaproteobacteria bacterium]
MQPGEHSQAPVQTQFGWHVISVEDRREVPPPPFEQVAPQIQRFLTTQRVQDYINELRGKAEISGVETGTENAGADAEDSREESPETSETPADEDTPESATDAPPAETAENEASAPEA